MDMSKLVEKIATDPDAFERLAADLRRKDAERLAAMSPEDREAELIRREESRREEEEYYLAMKDATVPYFDHRQEVDGLESIIDDLQGQLAELTEAAKTYYSKSTEEGTAKDKRIRDLFREVIEKQDELLAIMKRRNGMSAKINELTRKLKTAEAENARLRENGTK